MAAIQGITVILYDRVKTGTDAFNAPVYAESPTGVKNVLVCPVSTEDIITDLQLYGKRAEYELCIPKGDTHIWENRSFSAKSGAHLAFPWSGWNTGCRSHGTNG